ncbi:MAG: hypothetical protein SGI92_28205 [Bryobacteraceae bacterium]|nr:hypothetical protein [Bryobacteraceae bacterium]
MELIVVPLQRGARIRRILALIVKQSSMAIQLTPEQEQRIRSVVDTGAYSSAREALDAALSAVEAAAAPSFEGSQDELEGLLLEGLTSQSLTEEEFWESVDHDTDTMLRAHRSESQA